MKFGLTAVLAFILASISSLTYSAEPTIPPEPTAADLTPQLLKTPILVAQLLQQYHFDHKPIDATKANEWIKTYMEALDYYHMIFFQSDLTTFQTQYAADLPEKTLHGDISLAFTIFDAFRTRLSDRVKWIKQRLTQPFDFTNNDTYEIDRSKVPWPTNETDANQLWEKRLKFDILQEKLAIQHKEPPLKAVQHRYDRYERVTLDYDAEDILQTYLSALASIYDPHSQYMSPSTLEDFSIGMKLELVGIGAVLTSEDGYCVIKEIIPGGPADIDKHIRPNDKIVAVAQGNEPYIDVVDMKLRNIVKLIRGQKGTIVRLKISPAAANDTSVTKEITLTRDKIELAAQEASAQIIEQESASHNKYKIGVIDLPSFYGNVDDDDDSKNKQFERSTTEDVSYLIKYLKEQHIDGLILDLRRNGGGLLDEAVNLTGLFIDKGPVVQVKDSNGRIQVRSDETPGALYQGPLIVLTSRQSASASEITAGALQNYNRALIVGDKSTHGKGTVQAVVELGRFLSAKNGEQLKVGALKITIQKFYLPNGHSTQNRGVIPDISFPSPNDYLKIGETDLPYALAWDEIPSAHFKPTNYVNPNLIDHLKDLSEQRIQHNPLFTLLKQDIQQLKERMEKGVISLNETKRLKEREETTTRRKQAKEIEKTIDLAPYNTPKYIVKEEPDKKIDITPLKPEDKKDKDSDKTGDDDIDQDGITADIELIETTHIMDDWLDMTSKPTPITAEQ